MISIDLLSASFLVSFYGSWACCRNAHSPSPKGVLGGFGGEEFPAQKGRDLSGL